MNNPMKTENAHTTWNKTTVVRVLDQIQKWNSQYEVKHWICRFKRSNLCNGEPHDFAI